MIRTNPAATSIENGNDFMRRRPPFWLAPERGEGEGALSEEELYIDKHAEEEVCETVDATSFGPYDDKKLDSEEQRLKMRNEGRDEDGLSKRLHEVDRKRIIDALCSSLPVSQVEKEAVKSHFEVLNLDQFGNQKAVEKVGLATIRHVVDQRRRDHGANWEDLLRSSDEYEDVKESVLEAESGFMRLCQNVAEAIEAGGGNGWVSAPSRGRDPNLPDNR
jgi:hypothetical protein